MDKIKIKKLVKKLKNYCIHKHNYTRNKILSLKDVNVNIIACYSIISFVSTLAIIVNMQEYMNYINIKYSIKSYITTTSASAYNYNDTINNEKNDISENINLNSAKEYSQKIINLSNKYKQNIRENFGDSIYKIHDEDKIIIEQRIDNKIDEIYNLNWNNWTDRDSSIARLLAVKEIINESLIHNWINEVLKEEKTDNNITNTDNWKMTSWWWEVEKYKKDTISNVDTIITEIVDQTKTSNFSVKPTITKEDNNKDILPIVNSEIINNINNSTIKTDTINNAFEPIKIENNNNDTISININKEIENKLNELNANIFNSFKIKLLKDNNLVLENWVWYTYIFTKYQWYWKWMIPNENDLIDWWIDKETTILLLDDIQWTTFVKDYKKVKLISDSIISDIKNKQVFLNELADDKKYLSDDTDVLFTQLKTDTINLTLWENEYTKIQKIYDYILKNVSYSKFDINNKYIFSWIYTYKNKSWICTWYSKLDLYMLSFAWVSNAKVIRWNVVDALDFPNIWHAWIQIWSNYYDPTFDDPIWNINTKTESEYKYFWLPKDLFYTNRFNYWTLPENLKTANLEDRKNYVTNELTKLQEKYSWSNYNLLK